MGRAAEGGVLNNDFEVSQLRKTASLKYGCVCLPRRSKVEAHRKKLMPRRNKLVAREKKQVPPVCSFFAGGRKKVPCRSNF